MPKFRKPEGIPEEVWTAAQNRMADSICIDSLNTCEKLLAQDLWRQQCSPLLRNAALVQIVVNLRAVAGRADQQGRRVDVRDDVPDGDLTDHIVKLRDLLVHYDSGGHYWETNRINMTVFGAQNVLMTKDGVTIKTLYEDDTAFIWGTFIVYLDRHIRRMTMELRSIYPNDLLWAGLVNKSA